MYPKLFSEERKGLLLAAFVVSVDVSEVTKKTLYSLYYFAVLQM